jgi:hypothetical protein
MFPRFLFVALMAGFPAFVTGCARFTDGDVIGTWRFEDGNGVEELTLRADHSFSAIQTYKLELSTPSVFEDRGTWQIEGNELKINAALVYTPNDWKRRTGVKDTAEGGLIVNSGAGTKQHLYQRFDLPVCRNATPIAAGKGILERDLIGAWKMHFNTHDYQVRLSSDSEMTLLAFIEGKWDRLFEGKWRTEESRLVIRRVKRDPDQGSDSVEMQKDDAAEPTASPSESTPKPETAKDNDLIWFIEAIGEDCVSGAADGTEFTLLRLAENELNAPPPGPSVAIPSSPPPTETPSPAR